ncbi:MAG: outer membrane protein assembly factor BamE [Burkholderiales bacterium]
MTAFLRARTRFRGALAGAILLLVAGCAPYRIDVQQGNVVTQETVSKLRPAMTRAQVKYVLGTPLMTDLFHPDRWDYYYKFDKAGNPRERRRLTLVFEDDKLKGIIGDVEVAAGIRRLDEGTQSPAGPK